MTREAKNNEWLTRKWEYDSKMSGNLVILL